MALALSNPIPVFYDLDGSPLDDGYMWFGATNGNPITSPQTVYWDAAGVTPAAQPIRTLNGFPVRFGTPAVVYLAADCSMLVQNKSGGQVLYGANSADFSNASLLQTQINAFIARLADTTSVSNGDALIGVKRTDIASAVALTLHDWNQRTRVNVQQIGVTGDGSTDDATLLNTLGALGVPLFVPYTSTGYKIGAKVTFNCDVYCDGFFTPTSAIGGAANDYDRFAIVLADPASYSVKRRFEGVVVRGSVALRAANVSGIRIDAPNSTLTNCIAQQLNYGLVVRMYSVTLRNCAGQQCNTNLSGYARDSSHEINALCIDGGNYDSPVNVSINLGDTSWSDAMAAGNFHGVCIDIINAVNTDGGESRIDNCGAVNIQGAYSETTNTDCLWRLGGSGDGNVRTVRLVGNFWKTARYAVKCVSAVQGLEVGPNFCTGITSLEVKMSSDIYGINHHEGHYTGCFGEGPGPVGLAFRSLAIASVVFTNISIERDALINGNQSSPITTLNKFYPAGEIRNATTTQRNVASGATAFYVTPATAKAGTVSGGNFTFTTRADSFAFNGGDRIATAPAGALYIRSVDYATGIAVIDGGVTAAGAATISQVVPLLLSTTTTFSGVAPTTATWAQGSVAWNGIATVGQPKGWQCTVSGTPGTWVSQGNL